MDKEGTLDYLAIKNIYPMYSRKGKVFLNGKDAKSLTQKEREEFIGILQIKSLEDCKKIREEIKGKANNHRVNNFAKAIQIKAALELGKRLNREEVEFGLKIKNPKDVVRYVKEYYSPYIKDTNKEIFNLTLLDYRNKVIGNIELSKGNVNSGIVDPRKIIREATVKSASFVVLVHNHPLGLIK
ncbi:MAG TPA: JAB domain-containing protein [bacterium]|jgi:DNA repair protein RadC|nr:hypothetical protein [Dictyoglomota bacterium]HHV81703.1 hypothetical protein [bacterium]HOK30289.1 JAB domain-containing protein [bacterium]HOL55844.1 JAB domain-containing protein [bacterium]HON72213.1 JAB domain-containing protein [bacterium]